MTFRIAVLGAILPFLFIVKAHAQAPKNYLGIQIDRSEFDQERVKNFKNNNIKLKLGREIIDFLAIEGHAAITTDEAQEVPFKVDSMNYLGVFVRGNLPFERVTVYGLAGIGRLDVNSSGANGLLNGNKTSFAFGVGVEIYGNETTAVGLEYMRYIDSEVNGRDLNFDTIGIGLIHHFNFPSFR